MNPGPFRLLVAPGGVIELGAPPRLEALDDEPPRRRRDRRACPRCGCPDVVRVEHVAWNGMRCRRPVCRHCLAPARGR
jgi:hypothetical protein